MKRVFYFFQELFYRPRRMLLICVIGAGATLLYQGTFFQLWSLFQERERLQTEIFEVKTANQDLNAKIKRAQEPSFIEHQAREQFDLVEKDDLVFIFAEGE